MRKCISVVFILCCVVSLNAQTPIIDSLNNLIAHATSDTARINLTDQKVTAFIQVNLDSAVSLGKLNIANAQKINYQKGVGESEVNLAKGLSFKGDYTAAAQNLKSAQQIFTQLKDSAGLAHVYSGLGLYYGVQSIYDTSITYFKKVISIAEANHNNHLLNTTYQNLGASYQMLSDYSSALQYDQKALKAAEAENDFNSQAYIQLNLGSIYSSIEDTPRAEQALLRAIALSGKAHIKNVELYAYSNLSSLYSNMHKYNQAYNYAIKASELGKETGDIGMEATALSRAGLQVAGLKKFAAAEAMAKKATRLADSSNQPLNIYQTNADFGYILKLQNRYSEAIPYYEKAFGVLKKSDIYDNQVGSSYAELSDCYEKTGDYKKALQAYKLSAEINDSIRSKDNIRKATELSLNYEFDKKQQAVKAEQQKKDEIAKTKQTALLVGLVLMIILAAIAYYAFANKKKTNILLQRQKAELQGALSELKTTQAQLVHSEKMASLGELTAGIAHEIQNPLNFVNNFSEVNKEMLEELKAERLKPKAKSGDTIEDELINDVINNEEKINHHGKRADAIVKSMLQHSRKNTGAKEPTDINALADEYLRLSYHGLRAKDKNFNADFKTDFDETIGKINIVPQDIGRVLLNLFNNAFYATGKPSNSLKGEQYKPLVTVSTKCFKPPSGGLGVEIIVSDNGNGIPASIRDKIFQPFFTTKPTGEGTGLGLSLSYDIITKEHNGTIKVESKEGEGTSFIIQLPA